MQHVDMAEQSRPDLLQMPTARCDPMTYDFLRCAAPVCPASCTGPLACVRPRPRTSNLPDIGPDATPDDAITYNQAGHGWHLEMSGDTVTGLVIDGRALIAPPDDEPLRRRAMILRNAARQIDEILEEL
jgi:hypothetical protein